MKSIFVNVVCICIFFVYNFSNINASSITNELSNDDSHFLNEIKSKANQEVLNIDKGETGPLYSNMNYYIYLEKGDEVDIDYKILHSVCKHIDTNANGVHEEDEISYGDRGCIC